MFTTYVSEWLTYILVESSTGTRPSVTGMSNVTRTSAVRWVTTRELPLGCIKAARYTALAPMIRVRETIKMKILDLDILLAASLIIPFLKVNRAIVICLRINIFFVKTIFMSFV